jgi:hypothetical protein
MRPFSLVYLREYDWMHIEDQLRQQRLRFEAELMEDEPIAQGRLATARARLRNLWSGHLTKVSQPIEPSGS